MSSRYHTCERVIRFIMKTSSPHTSFLIVSPGIYIHIPFPFFIGLRIDSRALRISGKWVCYCKACLAHVLKVLNNTPSLWLLNLSIFVTSCWLPVPVDQDLVPLGQDDLCFLTAYFSRNMIYVMLLCKYWSTQDYVYSLRQYVGSFVRWGLERWLSV